MDEWSRDKSSGMFWKCQKVIKENVSAFICLRLRHFPDPVDDDNICLSSAPVELWCWVSAGNEATFSLLTADGASSEATGVFRRLLVQILRESKPMSNNKWSINHNSSLTCAIRFLWLVVGYLSKNKVYSVYFQWLLFLSCNQSLWKFLEEEE